MLVFLVLRYVSRTPFGLSLQGLRDEPSRMRALGFDVTRHRTLAFTFAALIASIGGLLSVFYNGRITPGSINLAQTIDVLIIAVVGGLYRLEGAWVGRAALHGHRQLLARLHADDRQRPRPERFNTLIGIVFLVIILVSPGGIVGLWEQGRDRLRGDGGGGTDPSTVGPGASEGAPAAGTVK